MISINDFDFEFIGHGHYKVTYTSPNTYKKWVKVVDNMPLIDKTKNEGSCATKSNLKDLKKLCKS